MKTFTPWRRQERPLFLAGSALDAGGLAAEVAEIVEARAANATLANNVDRRDRWRVQWEDALHARAEADAAHGEAGAAGAALLGDHYAFEGLDAFLDLFALAFLQADVYLDGVASAELGKVFAQLRFMQLTYYRIHFLYSLQTHSGGASTS